MDSDDDELQILEQLRLQREQLLQMSCWWFRRRQARHEKAKLRVRLAREAAALHAVSRKDYTTRTFIWICQRGLVKSSNDGCA